MDIKKLNYFCILCNKRPEHNLRKSNRWGYSWFMTGQFYLLFLKYTYKYNTRRYYFNV